MVDRSLLEIPEADRARLARALMRRQGGLGLRVASAFLVLVLGLPLVNDLTPETANLGLGGFTLSWLFLGVLIYPITVALSFYFVARSNRIEAEFVDWRATLAAEEARG